MEIISKELAARIEGFNRDSEELFKKYNLNMEVQIHFATKKNPPILSRFASRIIKFQGGQIIIKLLDNKK